MYRLKKMTAFVCWMLTPVFALVAVLLWVSESKAQRIVRWHRAGMSQAKIAKQLGCTRYAVKKALAAA